MVEYVFAHPNGTETGFINVLRYVDSLTDMGGGGAFGIIMLLIIWGGLFFSMKAFKTSSAFAVSCFITAIIGILIRVLLLANDYILWISIIGFVVGFGLILQERGRGE